MSQVPYVPQYHIPNDSESSESDDSSSSSDSSSDSCSDDGFFHPIEIHPNQPIPESDTCGLTLEHTVHHHKPTVSASNDLVHATANLNAGIVNIMETVLLLAKTHSAFSQKKRLF